MFFRHRHGDHPFSVPENQWQLWRTWISDQLSTNMIFSTFWRSSIVNTVLITEFKPLVYRFMQINSICFNPSFLSVYISAVKKRFDGDNWFVGSLSLCKVCTVNIRRCLKAFVVKVSIKKFSDINFLQTFLDDISFCCFRTSFYQVLGFETTPTSEIYRRYNIELVLLRCFYLTSLNTAVSCFTWVKLPVPNRTKGNITSTTEGKLYSVIKFYYQMLQFKILRHPLRYFTQHLLPKLSQTVAYQNKITVGDQPIAQCRSLRRLQKGTATLNDLSLDLTTHSLLFPVVAW